MDPEVNTPVADATPADPAAPAPAPVVAPVADPPAADPAAPAEPAAPAPAPVEDSEENPKPSKAVSELIAQRKKRQAAEQEAAYWKGVAEGRTKPAEPASPAAPAPVEPTGPPVAPKLDQFETYEQYEAAKDAFLIAKAKYDFRQEQQAEQQRQAAISARQKFDARIDAAAKEDPALLDVLADKTIPISPVMASLIMESEVSPQLIRWANANRDAAMKIAMLPPLQAARELGIIEAQIKFTPKPEPVKRVSAAPEPVTPVAPSSPATVDEADLPMDEYFRRRAPKIFGGR
jgi:hypothetical protein